MEVQLLLEGLPDDGVSEDIRRHYPGIEKVYRGIDRAEKEGELSQQDVEKRLAGRLGYPKRSRTLNRSPNAML